MKQYELVVLLHPDLEIDLDKPQKKLEGVIGDAGGKITKTDVWGKRKLAYVIGKEEFAVYVYYEVKLDPAVIGKLERTLNITDEVMRYLLTYPVPKVEAAKASGKEDNEDNEEEGSKPARVTKKAATAAEEE